MFVPILTKWSIGRDYVSPRVTLIGECQDLRGEPYMISTAIFWIKKAEEFNGKPYAIAPINKTKAILTVEFTLEFTNDKEADKFSEFIAQFNNRGFML